MPGPGHRLRLESAIKTTSNPARIVTQRRETVHKILIIRLSAIGDVILATSILPGLRERYPNAHITWLTEGLGAEVLREHPKINALWLLPRKEWRLARKEKRYGDLIAGFFRMRKQVCEGQFDLVIDLQGLLKSALWAWFSKAPQRISLRGRERSSLLMTHTVNDPAGMGGRLAREYRLMSEHLGLSEAVFAMDLYPAPDRLAKARHLLGAGSHQNIFLFPFTTRPQKHWFSERWSELAARLVSVGGYAVWIIGGPGNEAEACEIAKQAQVETGIGVIAGPTTDLQDKIALLSLADLSIGVDTGLTHLSLGLKRPTIALFGSTCPYQDTSPIPGIVLYDEMECSPCRRHPTCDGAFTCMRNHSVDRVLAAVKALI